VNNRKYEDLKDWQKAFHDLNAKIGSEAWGARLEGDGAKGHRIRVYIENEDVKQAVLSETHGEIDGNPIVFTVYSQKVHTEHLQMLSKKEELLIHKEDGETNNILDKANTDE